MVRRSGSSTVVGKNALEGDDVSQSQSRLTILKSRTATGHASGISKHEKNSEPEDRDHRRPKAADKVIMEEGFYIEDKSFAFLAIDSAACLATSLVCVEENPSRSSPSYAKRARPLSRVAPE